MKFGALLPEELEGIDLSLPQDHPKTAEVIKAHDNGQKTNIYVGCAKWGRKEWVGLIYPEKTKDKDFLSEYVKNFNGIELNGTFYSIKKAYVEKWAEVAPEGFKFCPKFSQLISHRRRLNNVEDMTEYYIDAASLLGDNLGVCFLQMPENFNVKKLEVLTNYIQDLPEDFPVTLELRHEDWFGDESIFNETFSMLESAGKGSVITDVAGRRDALHMRLTNGTAFIRWNGYDLHPTDYKRLDDWVERIKNWIELGINDIHFYCHQQNEANTPVSCDYLIEKLNRECDLDLPRPHFQN